MVVVGVDGVVTVMVAPVACSGVELERVSSTGCDENTALAMASAVLDDDDDDEDAGDVACCDASSAV